MGEKVSFSRNGSVTEGYLALPESGSGPGVIVIQEWWGLVGQITSVADRFAAEGFVALVPDLYHGLSTSEPDEAQRLLMGMAMDRAARDIAGAATHLAGLDRCTGRVGAVGFRMGGSLALWSAALSDEITTAVGFYPFLPWERMSMTWSRFAGKAALIHCSEEDGTSAAAHLQLARKAIDAAGGTVTLYDYPGTSHAFFNDDRPEVYDAAASAVAWARTLELLHIQLD